MKVISRKSAYSEPMPRKISVRTIVGSARTVAAEDAPGSVAICETWPSIPFILPSTAPAACRRTVLYFGQFSAKSAVRVQSP